MFPSVIPLEVSALVRTRKTDEAVADPVASKQIVSCEIPPHAPEESKTPPRSVSVDVIPFSLTFPEKPITGPPSRTEPDVISMSTQTEELEMLVPPHIPPCVRVAVPICIPPADIVSVMVTESAKAAGMTATVAATKTANSESLTLLRTDVPPFVRRRAAKALAVRPPSRLWKFEKITEILRADVVTSSLGERCCRQKVRRKPQKAAHYVPPNAYLSGRLFLRDLPYFLGGRPSSIIRFATQLLSCPEP
jgi:hypothetical protein